MAKMARMANKAGVKYLPIMSINLPRDQAKNNATEKKMMEKRIKLPCPVSPKKGFTVISNATNPVRGAAKAGPIIIKISTAMMVATFGGKSRVSPFQPPPATATAMMPINGKPTAVAKKPNMAGIKLVPAICPANGGKMIFPAPRKNAKVINPNANTSVIFNDLLKMAFLSFCLHLLCWFIFFLYLVDMTIFYLSTSIMTKKNTIRKHTVKKTTFKQSATLKLDFLTT